MSKPFYLTTTLPYVNSDPHVGFAMEIIRADAVVRYQLEKGREVFFNTGTDEHGQKLLTDALKVGKPVKEYVDHFASQFRNLKPLLGISDSVHFIRTTDPHHEAAAQKLWEIVRDNGFIYKKNYETKYCVGCELEKTDSELVDGRCPIHPNKDIEIINEENYFFAFSKCAPLLEKLYAEKPTLVIPDFRFNEAKAFLSRGLEDFSISRLKSKMSWGVAVPGDDDHVMYVWFDALTNYISTLGWPENANGDYKKFWEEGEKVQYCGKDNVRQQAMMWQAMLLAANLPTTDHIIIDGFINSGGQKMSKSLGNVISPSDVVEMFTPVAGDSANEVLRYYLLRHMNSFEDSDMTIESIKDAYQTALSNGIGNLTSRIMTLAEAHIVPVGDVTFAPDSAFDEAFQAFDLQKAMEGIWRRIKFLDGRMTEEAPFKLVKIDLEAGKRVITEMVIELAQIATLLSPCMPLTSAKILSHIKENKKPETPLFARLA